MSYDFGETESMEPTDLVPTSRYPVVVTLGDPAITPSTTKGTPGLQQTLTILAGPYKGIELGGMDMTVWLTGGTLHLLTHLTRQVTGMETDHEALEGFTPSEANIDSKTLRAEVKAWLEELDPDDRCRIMGQFIRYEKWSGKEVIAEIKLTEEPVNDPETGKQKKDENGKGITFWRNRLVSYYGHSHPKKGMSNWRAVVLPNQKEEAAR